MSPQNNLTFKTLSIFAFLCFHAIAAFPFSLNSFPKNTLLNAHAGSSGVVELQKDSSSSSDFYVEADLSYYPFGLSKASNSTNSVGNYDSVKMMISIANDETMVATNCFNFSSYDCDKYHCYEEPWNKTISFLSFNASVQAVDGYIYLDYFFWGLTQTNLYIAQSCQAGANPLEIGLDRYGILGLGTGNGSQTNFISDAIFSFYIRPDLKSGKLIFMNDGSYANSSDPLLTLSANSTWQSAFSNGSIQFSNCSINLPPGNVMFDVNFDAIGLPFDIYKAVTLGFFTSLNIFCEGGLDKAQCYYLGQTADLPDIILSINEEKISIPPKVYASATYICDQRTCFTLNFKGIGSTLPGTYYISPAFGNSIILGANFMSYYYTVFDGKSDSNLIYLYHAGRSNPDDGDLAKGIVGGIAGAILLISICYCAAKKNKQRTETPIDDNNNTAQAPLVYSSYNAQPQGIYQQPQGGTYSPGYGQN